MTSENNILNNFIDENSGTTQISLWLHVEAKFLRLCLCSGSESSPLQPCIFNRSCNHHAKTWLVSISSIHLSNKLAWWTHNGFVGSESTSCKPSNQNPNKNNFTRLHTISYVLKVNVIAPRETCLPHIFMNYLKQKFKDQTGKQKLSKRW